jgi:GTPase SAR1 family protein
VLAHRLVHDAFVPTSSTDGTWATQLKLPHSDPTKSLEREIWLWDFAGQADYRLIHQLFFDETALAILVFNPQSEDPFEGLAQWDDDLLRASSRPYRKLLVAGRVDRGRLIVSQTDIDQFIKNRKFVCYLETSALTGAGCADLHQSIVSSIPWAEIPWTASPRVFKILKDAIVALKDEAQRGDLPIVLRTVELKQQLEFRLPSEKFTLDELQAVIALLAGPGIIWRLSFGDFVLLQPEKINAYAAAVIRSVRRHPDEIGVIAEDKILVGDLEYADLRRLPRIEELIVLRAMHQTFVDRGLCLRQHTSRGTLLLFPSCFRRQRPDLRTHPAPLVTYRFRGALDEIYATLVVRLSHTSTFEKDQLWRFAADFLTPERRKTGFKMTKLGEGLGELTIYCDPSIPDDTKVTFIRYIHDHLAGKDSSLERERHYTCAECQSPIENYSAVKRRLARGEHDIACSDCEARVPLIDLIEQRFASADILDRAKALEAAASAAIDNESKELILVGHAFAVAGEAGQIFRPTPNSDWGIDGEIEFKDLASRASGARLYLQLKSGDSYLFERRRDGVEIFRVKNKRHLQYWKSQAYPVMLVVRSSDGRIRWMDVTAYLLENPSASDIMFEGEPFTAASLRQMRNKVISVARTS